MKLIRVISLCVKWYGIVEVVKLVGMGIQIF